MKFCAIMSVGWRFGVRILTRWLEDMKVDGRRENKIEHQCVWCVFGVGMMKFDKSRQICYSFHGYSSFLQEEEGWEMTQVLGGIFGVLCRMGWATSKRLNFKSYSFILLKKPGYLLLCNFLFVQRIPGGQNCR
ncbi:hypothetical protein POTOM_020996 [Populus tomentosa]|uniref:Uncharacterized protein n=1 Tax=Populus tomentosa TaxID=118781 RepID=A0A8X7ZML0_POPTO|nr:hypothetical protein POTOM_020996 [Populus tomentosa]